MGTWHFQLSRFLRHFPESQIHVLTLEELQAYLAEDIAKLEDQTGLDLGHWRV